MTTQWTDAIQVLRERDEPFVLVTVIGVQGSTPRESGTKMVITADQTLDTIGGGHLEFESTRIARELLEKNECRQHLEYFPLTARLGQCCGGSVSVLFEVFPATAPKLMLFGAGHVGKALVTILAGLPCRVEWVDSRAAEFPSATAGNVNVRLGEYPADEIQDMPAGTLYIVMTHNHQLDLELCEAILKRNDFAYLGVIGSKSKAIRFRKHLAHKGFSQESIDQMQCPIGLQEVSGKKPMEVAVSVAGQLIGMLQQQADEHKPGDGVNWRDIRKLIQQQS